MKKINLFQAPLSFGIFVSVLLFGLMSCEGGEEAIPAYIQINDFVLESTAPGAHGTVSQKITHASVFLIDNNSTSAPHQLGTITLPARVPSIVGGNWEINIDPVIKANGNSLSLELYPFYTRYKQNITLTPNEEIVIDPVTTYTPDAKFWLIEDFDSGGGHQFQTDRDNNPATSLDISDEDVFEGNGSGRVKLDQQNNVFVVATTETFVIDFPEAQYCFMEVDYKTDVPLEFGVISINAINDETPIFEFVVLPKEDWNKIYFDMTQLLATAPDNRFVFVIRGGIPINGEGEFILDEALVFMDNIKVVTF